eukprot:contig_2872_g585
MAEEPGIEGYLTTLAGKAWSDWEPPELGYGPSTASVPNPFRDPSTAVRHRRIAETLVIERRGLLVPAWASSMTRAKAYFDLKRWLPGRPSWWTDYGPYKETPLAVPQAARQVYVKVDTSAKYGFWARVGAVDLLGTDWVEELRERMVPRKATAGALAIGWSRQIGELEGALHRVSGMTAAEAVESLILKVARLKKVHYVRDSMLAELRSDPEVEVRDASPRRVDLNAILGVRRVDLNAILGVRRRSVEEDDEKEPPVAPNVRHIRSRSPSYDGDRRRHN